MNKAIKAITGAGVVAGLAITLMSLNLPGKGGIRVFLQNKCGKTVKVKVEMGKNVRSYEAKPGEKTAIYVAPNAKIYDVNGDLVYQVDTRKREHTVVVCD